MDNAEETEQILSGGNFDSNVVRIGTTVRRATGPWTPAVHALLDHLHAVGFTAAPRALGLDDAGREILSFIDGEPGHYPLTDAMRSDELLTESVRLLRRFHDATVEFHAPEGTVWRSATPDPGLVEVVCHTDWAPYNAIVREDHLAGMIDWDFARPGSRLWDLAWMTFTWVPLRDDDGARVQGWTTPPVRATRLRLVCDAYGLTDRNGLLPAIRARVLGMAEWLEDGARRGEHPFVDLVEAGHAAGYRRAVAYLDGCVVDLQEALK